MEHNSRRVRSAPIVFLILFLLMAATPFIPLGNDSVSVAEGAEENVYLGGMPIGIRLTADGLVALEYVSVVTKEGAVTPAKDAGILKGDMLTELNGVALKEVGDIASALSEAGKPVPYKLIRGSEELSGTVVPVLDIVTNSPKIGLIVKNDISGVGTVTFIKENGRICTLGHMISDGESNPELFKNGYFYRCNVLGVVKSRKNSPGSLKGIFNRNSSYVGTVDSNSDFGVYGQLTDASFSEKRPRIKIGEIKDVKPGKASVYTTLEGSEPEEYDVEIVKYETQAKPEIKGLVIRVTDSELLDKAAGIVQGMSGSPIVQNGKLVGAVTHVFVNDPVYGYGIFARWMAVK